MTRVEHFADHSPVQILEQRRTLHQPVGHQGVRHLDAQTRQAAGNAIQRQSIGELTHDQIGQEARRGHGFGQRLTVRKRCPDDAAMAAAAGIFLAPCLQDLDRGRHIVKMLCAIHAERAHRRATLLARAIALRNVQHLDHPGQTPRYPHRFPALTRPGAPGGVRRGRRRLRYFDNDGAICEERHLIDVDDLAATSELVLE